MNLRTLRLLEYNKIVEMLTSYAASRWQNENANA